MTGAASSRWLRTLDRFIPARLLDDDELRLRSRLLVGISFQVPLFAFPLMGLAFASTERAYPTGVTLGLGAAAVATNPFLLRARGKHELPGVLMCLELIVGLVILAYFNSGLYSASLLWLLPVPLVAHLVVGPRFGLAAAMGCALVVASFYALSVAGIEFPQTLSGGQMTWWHMAGLVTVVTFIGWLGWLYEAARREAYQALQASVSVVARKNRALERTGEALARSHRKLQEAQVELVERERLASVGQVAAGVAHELRNPLNGIKMIAQHALREVDPAGATGAELTDDLREMITLTDSASSIIDDIRVSTDYVDPGLQPVDTQTELARALRLLRREFERHDIRIVEEISELPKALAEPGRLQQVLLNLLQNAVDALADPLAARTDRAIKIVGRLSPDETHVELLIQDNAGGIPEPVQRQMFEPFFTTKSPGRGTGLGLAISRRLAEQCSGRLSYDAGPGEGSTFTISLLVWRRETTLPPVLE